MANLSTLHVETVRTEITRNNFGLLDFFAKHGFTPSQRLVLSRRVEQVTGREGRLSWGSVGAVDVRRLLGETLRNPGMVLFKEMAPLGHTREVRDARVDNTQMRVWEP